MRMRLDKYLSSQGVGSRNEVKKLVRAGCVHVNGVVAKDADMKVDTETCVVEYDGAPIEYRAYEYFMLNKPAGIISASNDATQETVVDLVKDAKQRNLFPVGRLDKDTVGLLLITNDGQLAHRLLSPGHHVDKTYFARLDKPATCEDVAQFAEGIDIGDDDLTMPAVLEIPASDEPCEVLVTIREGRYHQIKRMFEMRGNKVVYLKRLSMGPLVLDQTLAEGESRPLTAEELSALQAL